MKRLHPLEQDFAGFIFTAAGEAYNIADERGEHEMVGPMITINNRIRIAREKASIAARDLEGNKEKLAELRRLLKKTKKRRARKRLLLKISNLKSDIKIQEKWVERRPITAATIALMSTQYSMYFDQRKACEGKDRYVNLRTLSTCRQLYDVTKLSLKAWIKMRSAKVRAVVIKGRDRGRVEDLNEVCHYHNPNDWRGKRKKNQPVWSRHGSLLKVQVKFADSDKIKELKSEGRGQYHEFRSRVDAKKSGTGLCWSKN
jgi:hypothetical protein